MSTDDTLGEKLDILIRLQAAALVREMDTQKEKIAFLSQAGLGPSAIADLLGTSPNSVSVALSGLKKKGKASGKGK
ncbi:MAG: hypothetical protein V2J51_12615 [Erythrobacter sp.]|jgi:hypothetical protein|nr:hypothetical protein [Erythrobacter sp.]